MSPAPKLFFTGVTGYIGGDLFHEIYTAHPDWDYTCLVRSSDKAAPVAAKYPSVHFAYGNGSDAALLEEEASKADIIVHPSSADDVDFIKALLAGLVKHSPDRPGYLVHTSGTGILIYPDMDKKTFGEYSTKIWDDVKDINELTNLPDHALHRNVDKLVMDAGSGDAAKAGSAYTAIVCPPTIYGTGRGPGNIRSVQLPGLASAFLERGAGFKVGEGKSIWTQVHVRDLSIVYRLLVEDAAKALVEGSKTGGGIKATWGPQGYYFTENGEFVWGEVFEKLAQKAQALGYIKSDETPSPPFDEITKLHPAGVILWGSNSRCRATRARQELDWKPSQPLLWDTLEECLRHEKGLRDNGEKASQRV